MCLSKETSMFVGKFEQIERKKKLARTLRSFLNLNVLDSGSHRTQEQ